MNDTHNKVSFHYDLLIEQNNDPVHDPEPLKRYMDKWDGVRFIKSLEIDKSKTVLEIGVGTGRLAIRTAPLCKEFYGIDVSPMTIKRAMENLQNLPNVKLVCNDYLKYDFENLKFDIIYSSLTFMHIEDKQSAFDKSIDLLAENGRFVLSLDKNKDEFIDIGANKIKVYPDNPEMYMEFAKKSEINVEGQYETEFANIIVFTK